MKWNIGAYPSDPSSTSKSAQLPPDHPPIASSSTASRRPPPSCPMSNSPLPAAAPRSAPAKCPIPYDTSSASPTGLNPFNSIPLGLSSTEPSPNQSIPLPTDRTASSIPRPKSSAGGDDAEVWEYPSPQQFYNALVRKGREAPEESMEMVVAIHNFLNERAWDEVMKWEKRLPGGDSAQLAKFQGRPGELSPKARLHLWMGKIFPDRFITEPPFDRHDWMVTRSPTTSTSPQTTVTTRYVIDYYGAPPDEDGNPCFNLDVRPALDSFESVSQRVKVGLEEFLSGKKDE